MSLHEQQKEKSIIFKRAIFPILYFISGIMLVVGNVFPWAAFFFYIAIILVSYLIFRGYINRLNTYCFLAPYFLMLGISVWNNVFPYYLGIVLAILMGDLFSRILYRTLNKLKEKSYNYLAIPVLFFLFDFLFRNIPAISFIHMIPVLSPLSKHGFIIKTATVFGGRVTLLLVTLLLSAAAKILSCIRNAKSGGIVLASCAIMILLPNNLVTFSADANVIKEVSVACIQGSYTSPSINMEYEDYINHKLQYYMNIAQSTDADITVFPETVLGVYDTANEIDQTYRENLTQASNQLGGLSLYIVTEGNSVTISKDDRFISAILFNEGEIEGISRKRNLVPFSEAKNYSSGKDYDVYETQFGKIGVSICYDINAKTVENLKNNGAQLILAPFNDSGFDFIYHNIHRYFPVIKAAECAVPIIVSNEDGISQIVDCDGRIVSELGFAQKGSITQKIQIKNTKSLYLLFGIYLEWILFSGIICVAIVYLVRFFRMRKKADK